MGLVSVYLPAATPWTYSLPPWIERSKTRSGLLSLTCFAYMVDLSWGPAATPSHEGFDGSAQAAYSSDVPIRIAYIFISSAEVSLGTGA